MVAGYPDLDVGLGVDLGEQVGRDRHLRNALHLVTRKSRWASQQSLVHKFIE